MSYHLKNVDEPLKEKIRAYGLKNYGTKNIRYIIFKMIENQIMHNDDNEIVSKLPDKSIVELKLTTDKEFNYSKKRIYTILYQSLIDELEELANERKCGINYYIKMLILNHLKYKYLIDGNELEELRKSNYQIGAVGKNLNQIAKKINTMNSYDPEDLKIVIDLANKISQHTNLVSNVLEATQKRW